MPFFKRDCLLIKAKITWLLYFYWTFPLEKEKYHLWSEINKYLQASCQQIEKSAGIASWLLCLSSEVCWSPRTLS